MHSEEEYTKGAELLLDFLSSEYDEAGESRTAPNNIQFYYKMPAVLAYGGRRRLALSILQQFQRKFVLSDGLNLDNDPIAKPWSAYLAGWAAWGAGSLGYFDLARKIMYPVIKLQHPELGGFMHFTEGGSIQDTERSSAAAMGCVWSMMLKEGLEVAKFLNHALEHQPEQKTFYTYFDLDGKALMDRSDRNAYFSLDDPHARPALFATSIACLVWLGRVTQDSSLVSLAESYMNFLLSHEFNPARLPLATKTGWAAMMILPHLTRESRSWRMMLDFATNSADNLLERQQADGRIDFDTVFDVPKPVDKVWHIGWGCDAVLTLIAIANKGA